MQRAPRLRPNTVPRTCKAFVTDPLGAWPASEAQRKALAKALEARRRKVRVLTICCTAWDGNHLILQHLI